MCQEAIISDTLYWEEKSILIFQYWCFLWKYLHIKTRHCKSLWDVLTMDLKFWEGSTIFPSRVENWSSSFVSIPEENQLLSSKLWQIYFLRSLDIFQMKHTWISKCLLLRAVVCISRINWDLISIEILDY